MKFNTLYRHLFLTEQDENTQEQPEKKQTVSEVPEPDNYGVEPLPVTKPVSDNGNLAKYIIVLNEFAKTMQNTEGACLQKLVTDIDRNGSLFMGITREVSSSIIKIASDAKDIATILEGFILNSAKRQRDIAAGQ